MHTEGGIRYFFLLKQHVSLLCEKCSLFVNMREKRFDTLTTYVGTVRRRGVCASTPTESTIYSIRDTTRFCWKWFKVRRHVVVSRGFWCSGSLTFCQCSGSADPYLGLTDPAPAPDPDLFVIDLQGDTIKFHLLITVLFEGTLHHSLQ